MVWHYWMLLAASQHEVMHVHMSRASNASCIHSLPFKYQWTLHLNSKCSEAACIRSRMLSNWRDPCSSSFLTLSVCSAAVRMLLQHFETLASLLRGSSLFMSYRIHKDQLIVNFEFSSAESMHIVGKLQYMHWARAGNPDRKRAQSCSSQRLLYRAWICCSIWSPMFTFIQTTASSKSLWLSGVDEFAGLAGTP